MNKKINHKKQGVIALALLSLLTIGSIFFAGFGTTEANALIECPNGPLRANLTGADLTGKTPSGTAQFNDKSNNELMVRVRSVNLPANTTVSVFVGDTNVGQMTIPKSGNAQFKLDSATGITEGTIITVRNGETTILTGSFVCVANNGNTNTNTNPTASPTATATTSPTMEPTMSPTMEPTASPTPTPTATVTPTPTVTATPTITPTPTPTVPAA